jgi:hypothetical protein
MSAGRLVLYGLSVWARDCMTDSPNGELEIPTVSENPERNMHNEDDGDLFEEIRSFLNQQSGDEIYEDIRAAYQGAQGFVKRELLEMEEYQRMLRALEKLLEEEFSGMINPNVRGRMAEVLYTYGLAHYSLLQHPADEEATPTEPSTDESRENGGSRPLIIYDLWFPQDIAIERAQDGYYMHLSDGRIDLTLYLGTSANQRSALVDLVDHWGYAAASDRPPGGIQPGTDRITPMLTIELDYAGSELIDADDHVDIIFFDEKSEPLVRMHARAAELRMIVDELQALEQDSSS